MKKVLIIRLGAIGDVVETTGTIRALKNNGWTVDYLTGKAPAQLLKYDEDINNLYILESKKYSSIYKLALKLRKEKYNLILNLQPSSLRYKFLCFIANAKKVVNYKKSYKFHAVENFFETAQRTIPELKLDKNLKLFIPKDIKTTIEQQLENKLRICFNTGANSTRQGRKWCIEYWIKLAELIFNKYDAQIYVVGGKEDEESVLELLEKFPQIKSFVGKTSLIETAALLSCANIVISGDTGPLHIASATETTCIGLYGNCSVSRSGPYGENHKTISSDYECSPCDKRKCIYLKSDIDDTPCMRKITPEKVINLVDTIISK